MKPPKRLLPLLEYGLIDDVIHPLTSGKEADVYVVRCGDEERCAKIYKEAHTRSFKQAVKYTEGRKVRNSRRARAMEKGSRYGREQQEDVWQNAEVSALYRLDAAGVRVPRPYGCLEGVLLMELITDDSGDVAPRLADVRMSAAQAVDDFGLVIRYVVRMLCAGIVHGDLSEFNVLVDEGGPVIIDLPQAVDAASNNNAKDMFVRDVTRMTQYYGLFEPALLQTRYAAEIWSLYEDAALEPETELTGEAELDETSADLDGIMREIESALEEHLERQAREAEDDQN